MVPYIYVKSNVNYNYGPSNCGPLSSGGEHRTGIGGSGPENEKPDRVLGDFGGPDIRYFEGRGFQVSRHLILRFFLSWFH